jgi:hypothetical protein
MGISGTAENPQPPLSSSNAGYDKNNAIETDFPKLVQTLRGSKRAPAQAASRNSSTNDRCVMRGDDARWWRTVVLAVSTERAAV